MDTTSDSILIYRNDTETVTVNLPYSPERVDRIRTVADRRWNADIKCWEFPGSLDIERILASLFPEDTIHIVEGAPQTQRQDAAPPWLTELNRELRLRGFSPKTRKAYIGHSRRLIQHFGRPPGQITEDDIRGYLTNILENGASHSYVGQCISAIKFLYHRALRINLDVDRLPRPKKGTQTPLRA